MGAGETSEVGDLIDRVVDELGIAVFVVEHDMRVVREFADHVYVLNQAGVRSVEVRWPGGKTQVVDNPQTDKYLTISER